MSDVDSNEAVQFRRAQRQDVPAIVALVESAYRGAVSKKGWTTEADLLAGQRTDRDEVSELIGGEHSRIVLAERNAELVGSVMMARVVHGQDDTLEVGMLAVRPDLQSGGLGRALLAEVERCVRVERLGTRLRMTVIGQRSELIAWYERRGFGATGETKPFPYGQPRFGLPRRPDLYFRVLEKQLSALS